MKTDVVANPWQALRRYTPARIALGRSGVSLPTGPQLDFRLAHARARDAVNHGLDVATLAAGLHAIGLENVALDSAAPDRATYLRRPDLGRMLDSASRDRLCAGAAPGLQRFDLAFVIADGLSALAVQRHACPLLAEALQCLRGSSTQWRIAPVAVVTQARVAIGDEIGACLRAALVVVLIGERPGLSSPDSLGIYLTWDPRPGRLDSHRNCISNVRPEGLPYPAAAQRLCRLLEEARRRRVTGIELKDDSDPAVSAAEPRRNFLVAGGGIASEPAAD